MKGSQSLQNISNLCFLVTDTKVLTYSSNFCHYIDTFIPITDLLLARVDKLVTCYDK